MGTISSGVGLLSGLPIRDIVDQLMAIESAPLNQLQQRRDAVAAMRTAFLELSARLLGLKSAATRLDDRDFFRQAKASSSDENVIVATAAPGATPGTYSFQVLSLVSTHQLVSSGFADVDRSPVGAGTLSFEIGYGSLSPSTPLDLLNGQRGVRRGLIRITDRSGASVDVDLTAALTVDDVLAAINSQTAVSVLASVEDDRIVLTDTTGQTLANLSVEDLAGGHAAADLGIAGAVAGDVLIGQDVSNLADGTQLDLLNDGNGVRRDGSLDDFRVTLRDGRLIDVSLSDRLRFETALAALNGGSGVRLGRIRLTDRSGAVAEVDLSGAQTVRDVVDAIAGSGLGVTVSLAGSHLLISDSTGSEASNLKIEDVDSFAAHDLGIAADVADNSISGSDIYRVDTIGDVIRAINYDSDNDGSLVASISADGNGIVLTDGSAGGGQTKVEALNGSQAAADLGIETQSDTGQITGRHLIAGLNTVLLRSLRGGSGIGLGTIRITDRSGSSAELDLSGLQTVEQLLRAINESSVAVSARLNASGTGIVVQDLSGGAGNLRIEDVTGSAAADLGIALDAPADQAASGNLQLQYISEMTRLSELNAGRGVSAGRFRITDSAGNSAVIDLSGQNVVRLGDVIERINASSIGVVASINATGDGLLLTDTAGGGGTLKVTEESGGRTARDLGILGESAEGQHFIDGSFEVRIEIDGDDTLQEVADKINAAGADVQAAVINDGSAANPYRLTIRSMISGTAGRLVFDTGTTGLELGTLVRPRDAVVLLGGPSAESAVVISSSTNSLTEVIPEVTLELVGTSSQPVTISVSEDVEAILSDLNSFVQSFNEAIDRIDELTAFNPDTMERGLLLGDPTVERIRRQLYDMITRPVEGVSGQFDRLNQVGLSIGGGARLQLDEQRFRQAYAADRLAVQELFTLPEEGIGDRFDSILDRLTNSFDGVLSRKDDALQRQEDLFQQRIEHLQGLLDRKEQRLLSQFQAMESALAQLQAQQSALASLQFVVPGGLAFGASGGG